MADDPNPDDPKPDPKKDPAPDPDAGAKKALDAERKARREAEKREADLKARLDELENAGKGETEKLTEQLGKLQSDLDNERVMRLKAEVAADKGLTQAQAKRLTGTSKEELEADADDLLEAFPAPVKEASDDPKRPPSRRPAAALRGGGDPTEEPVETDPAKLADSVPRL